MFNINYLHGFSKLHTVHVFKLTEGLQNAWEVSDNFNGRQTVMFYLELKEKITVFLYENTLSEWISHRTEFQFRVAGGVLSCSFMMRVLKSFVRLFVCSFLTFKHLIA